MRIGAWIVTVFPLVAIAFICTQFRPQRFGVMEISGAALALFGFALLTVARLQLGNSFSLTPQARQLVTTGIYSRIRNPIYVFSTIGLAGLAMYFERPILLLGLLILVPLQIPRARAERKVLLEKFGDEYSRYEKQTWF